MATNFLIYILRLQQTQFCGSFSKEYTENGDVLIMIGMGHDFIRNQLLINTILRDACFYLDRPLIVMHVMAKVCPPLWGIKYKV